MALTAIALCSRALLMLGASSIASFDEGTAEAEIAANLFPSLRDALLSAHPWNFALREDGLARLVDAPAAPYAATFQMPDDCLRVLSAGRGVPYRVRARLIDSQAGAVSLIYVARVPEAEFPPFFDQALIARLAAEFCLPLTESTSRADYLRRVAEEEFRRARLIDAQEDTTAALDDFPLIEVRG